MTPSGGRQPGLKAEIRQGFLACPFLINGDLAQENRPATALAKYDAMPPGLETFLRPCNRGQGLRMETFILTSGNSSCRSGLNRGSLRAALTALLWTDR